MCMSSCLHKYVCTVCPPGIPRGQKKMLGLLELEVQTVVSQHGVMGTESMSPTRAASAVNHDHRHSDSWWFC